MRAALLLALVACHSAAKAPPAAKYEVHVDPRVELVATVEMLAGLPEYQTAPSTSYTADVKKHFAAYANHGTVVAARELRAKYGISYDAPMTFALSLDANYELHQPLTDPRLSAADMQGFAAQLRDFAKGSDFDAFFAAHRAYYAKVEDRLRTAIEKENPRTWFDTFFGTRATAHFTVVPGMLTGNWNYGPHIGDEIFQVIGVARTDVEEMPAVDDATIELVVHEMAHSYVNPILAAHKAELEAAGSAAFAKVEEPMKKQAYTTWDIFLNESVVRAITSLYLRDRRGAAAADAAIQREEARSFLWTRPIAELLDKQRGHFEDAVSKLASVLQ